MTYAVIMAGGIGTRFWPRSRKAHPKQFLSVFDDSTLIQNTVARLQGLVPPERCLIVTHERYVEQTKTSLPSRSAAIRRPASLMPPLSCKRAIPTLR